MVDLDSRGGFINQLGLWQCCYQLPPSCWQLLLPYRRLEPHLSSVINSPLLQLKPLPLQRQPPRRSRFSGGLSLRIAFCGVRFRHLLLKGSLSLNSYAMTYLDHSAKAVHTCKDIYIQGRLLEVVVGKQGEKQPRDSEGGQGHKGPTSFLEAKADRKDGFLKATKYQRRLELYMVSTFMASTDICAK
ncbi:hypothetical protein Ancab_008258 [Ancistrocladus abbreviatus]